MLYHNSGNRKVNYEGKVDLSRYTLSTMLLKNVKTFKAIFENDSMLRIRVCENAYNKDIRCAIFFIDGMATSEQVNESIVKPIVEIKVDEWSKERSSIDEIYSHMLYAAEVKKSTDLDEIVRSVVYGDTALMAEGSDEVLIINSKGWETRSISEPPNEKTLRGPHEGFTESLLKNTSLIRRRLRTSDLKFKSKTLGTRSNTGVCLCYLESIVNKDVLRLLEERLNTIVIDGVLETNYIEELIRDNPWTPMKTAGATERPDVVVGKLLEGRIAIIVDGSPTVMTVPYLFVESVQTDDDYYLNYYFASIGRLLRVISILITTIVPGFYVALVAFHKEMIPSRLALSISAARDGVPLPIAVECLVMLAVFELLRESGLRMPSNVGSALSIVGAIVIGQAAVQAKFVSAPMVIIVAITGITGLVVPKIKAAVLLYRTFLVLMASVMGMYGLVVGISIIIAHVVSLTSYGVKYTSFLDSVSEQERKDVYLRYSWRTMKTRPANISSNVVRKGEKGE
ncbi:MAG: spore germination protein [Bacillota bacterium]|nr:spore germination protein [Bacillota bacterium]